MKHCICYICCFTIDNSIHNLLKIIKYSSKSNIFTTFMGFQNADENVFYGLGNLVIRKVLEICSEQFIQALCIKME